MSKQNKIKVSIIDYGMGNLFSVKQACEHIGLRTLVTSKAEDVFKADGLILPGVGSFGNAMSNLTNLGLGEAITDFIKKGKPFMGICLGMQLLFSESDEFGKHKGLDLIKGKVIKFSAIDKDGNKAKVPQVGWNRIKKYSHGSAWDKSPLKNIREGSFMYFVHSYYCNPGDSRFIASTTEYAGIEYCSSVLKDNIYASQFHPEKSAQGGLQIYSNWLNYFK